MRLYLFAHNMHFDAMIVDLFGALYRMGFKQTTHPVTDQGLVILEYNRGTQTLLVLDTLNYFRSSLEEIGKSLHLPKLRLKEPDFVKRNALKIPARLDEELRIYCERDVEVCESILLEYIKLITDNDLGSFQKTLPSQAFCAFTRKFMNDKIFIHCNTKATDLERLSYHGGRNEAFYIGVTDECITCLDFNSLYPSVMIDNKYPINLVGIRLQNDYDDLIKALDKYLVIARLKIKVDKPLFPYVKDRLLFPVGSFWGVFTTPEIERMIKDDCILEVGTIAKYEWGYIFREYVKWFYNMRLHYKEIGNDVFALLFKYFLNMLYGKFGQITRSCECLGDCSINDVYSELKIHLDDKDRTKDYAYQEKCFGGKKYAYKRTMDESFNSFCAISSHVTAYGRMKLLEAIEKAKWENVLYGDTDSIFVTNKGLKNVSTMIDSKKLGYMKKEYTSILGMNIKACKDYIIYPNNDEIGFTVKMEKIKGVGKNSIQLDENDYKVYRFMKINSSIKNGNVAIVREFPMFKHLSRNYEKGVVGLDGWVKPLVIEE